MVGVCGLCFFPADPGMKRVGKNLLMKYNVLFKLSFPPGYMREWGRFIAQREERLSFC